MGKHERGLKRTCRVVHAKGFEALESRTCPFLVRSFVLSVARGGGRRKSNHISILLVDEMQAASHSIKTRLITESRSVCQSERRSIFFVARFSSPLVELSQLIEPLREINIDPSSLCNEMQAGGKWIAFFGPHTPDTL